MNPVQVTDKSSLEDLFNYSKGPSTGHLTAFNKCQDSG